MLIFFINVELFLLNLQPFDLVPALEDGSKLRRKSSTLINEISTNNKLLYNRLMKKNYNIVFDFNIKRMSCKNINMYVGNVLIIVEPFKVLDNN